MTKLTTIRHDYLRYANVWEDAAILLRGLSARAGERHLSIASAGDNAFMLLTTDPEMVVAVDINGPQLYLSELKREAIRVLSREEYLAFTGFEASTSRREVWETIAPRLTEPARLFWQQNFRMIDRGMIHGGKFERYFRLFSGWILPLIHGRKAVHQLLAPKSAEAQADFYDQKWNTWRWRLMFRIFFSKFVMGQAGRDPAFLKEVEVSVGDYIFQKAEQQLRSTDAQQNHILRYNLTGNFGHTWPDYVQPQHYDKIKANVDRLQLHQGFVESAFDKWGKFDCFNLSNIFEYMDEATCKLVGAQLLSGANEGARLAYWNLMVPRNLAGFFPERLSALPIPVKTASRDRGFFYNKFIVNVLNHAAADH